MPRFHDMAMIGRDGEFGEREIGAKPAPTLLAHYTLHTLYYKPVTPYSNMAHFADKIRLHLANRISDSYDPWQHKQNASAVANPRAPILTENRHLCEPRFPSVRVQKSVNL